MSYRFYPNYYPMPPQMPPQMPYPPMAMRPPIPMPPGPPPAPVPGKMESFLQQTSQFMKTAQTYAPYVQQAMPMIRNLPALLQLYKGFQQMPSQAPSEPSPPRSRAPRQAAAPTPEPLQSRPSLPKIYQP